MSLRRALLSAIVAGATVLAAPATAFAHAYLLRTTPSASVVVNKPPARLSLTYDEAIEPRFAIVSVTDAAGHQEVAGRPRRASADPATLMTPLKRVAEGWYLVYWRVISADGHPVRGAFTFAVGPNEGPPPQFVIPSLTESATTPGLLALRWLSFLAAMTAIGLAVLRLVIVRPLVERVPGASLRPLSLAFAVAAGLALLVVPVYVEVASAQFALRSIFDLGGVLPLLRSSAFGRGWLDLELVFALFVAAAAIAVVVDRPERSRRTLAALLSLAGALACAAAVLLVPALAGHAAQTRPRGLSLLLDWLHLAAGSVWLGGLIGLLVLWPSLGPGRRRAGLGFCVPRFSRVALLSVLALIGSGIGASIVHLPTLGSLWQTSYGKALVVKIALLIATMPLAAVNLLRNRPRLAMAAGGQAPGAGAAGLLRGLVGGEVVLVTAALFAAAVLSSLPPPPPQLATLGHVNANVGPGSVARVVRHGPYELRFLISPNKVAVQDSFAVRITKNGQPVHGADIAATFTMLDMEMQQLAYTLPERGSALYSRSAPALVMVGRWGLSFEVHLPGVAPFTVLLVDHARG